jgi:hypothetical protein
MSSTKSSTMKDGGSWGIGSACVLAALGKNSKGTAACLAHGGGRCQANSACINAATGTNSKHQRACITHGGIAAEHPRPPAPGAYAAAQRR